MRTARLYLAVTIVLLAEALLGVPTVNGFSHVGAMKLGGSVSAAVIDSTGTYAYLGSNELYPGFDPEFPSSITKVRLSDLELVSTLTLKCYGSRCEREVSSAIIDNTHGYAYFALGNGTGLGSEILGIRLSDFTRIPKTLNLTGLYPPSVAAIDTSSGYGYFVASFPSGGVLAFTVLKIRLSDLTLVDKLFLPAYVNFYQPLSAVIDPSGFLLFAATEMAMKIRLSDFSIVSAIQLSDEPIGDSTGTGGIVVTDPSNNYAYFSSCRDCVLAPQAIVVKVRISDFAKVDELTMPSTVGTTVWSGAIDATNGYAYFSSNSIVEATRLSDFTIAGSMRLYNETTYQQLGGWALIDQRRDTRSAYFYTYPNSGPRIDKIELSEASPSTSPSPVSPWWNPTLPIPYWPLPLIQTVGVGGAICVMALSMVRLNEKRRAKRRGLPVN